VSLAILSGAQIAAGQTSQVKLRKDVSTLEMPNRQRGLILPQPESAQLEYFSLYEREVSVETDFTQAPIFCLVGANGLGKSTYLSALSYAITGAVAEPGRSFRDVADYYKRARTYAPKYFRGRITARDSEAAQVTLTMRVGSKRYQLTRGINDPAGLRDLRVTNADTGTVLRRTDDLDDEARNLAYMKEITVDVGLDDFAQLAFLQLFVLSFDERRELLFWTPKILQQALYISFDLDPGRAKEAEKLNRKVEGLDSNARGAQWQATIINKQLEALESAGEEVFDEVRDQVGEQKDLEGRRDEAVQDVDGAERSLKDGQLQLAEQTAQLQALRSEYDVIWTQRLQGSGNPASHPLVISTLDDSRCAVCGTEGLDVVKQVNARLDHHHCPLCDSAFDGKEAAEPKEILGALGELDKRITILQEAIADSGPVLIQLEREQADRRAELRSASEKLASFEERNLLAGASGGDTPNGLKAVADRYRAQIADLHDERDEKRKERDKVRRKLKPLQEALVQSYRAAEDEFVPSFNELARRFLGLELEVSIEQKKDTVGLALSVQGTKRRAADTLSESQRFFIDIALRMALIEQMSSEESPGCLFVDTPEGSLDIAYESRAGEMFALFVEHGHQLLMTANINTSQLLRRLAALCGKSGLNLERMTEWTDLSEVQVAEEKEFERAWTEILSSLGVAE
jgi:DNA repair exonuclease SbcCD ATPase subunit